MSNYLILGLLGHPLSHSLSPILHTAALKFANLKGEYRLFDIQPEKLDFWLEHIPALGISGFNITIPYKERLYKFIEKQTIEAKLVGAINTVKIENDGQISGHNTDVIGFQFACKEAFDTSLIDRTALIIGAGGAARAVIVALAQIGIKKIFIKSRDIEKVNLLISQMQKQIIENIEGKEKSSQISLFQYEPAYENEINLLINASAIGFVQEPVPDWLIQLINKLGTDCLCFDLVYNKNKSKPLVYQLAANKGLPVTDGLSMLIHQARFAFEYWTGINVPSNVLYQAIS
jgi:shikimate dehydrogenase